MTLFLTSVDILDTGFLKVGRTTPSDRGTTQASSSTRINSGSALRLRSVELEIKSSANLNKSPVPGKFNHDSSSVPKVYEGIQCAVISSNPTEFTMTLFLNSNNTDTSNDWGINDMALLDDLLLLPHTPWFKAMYYPVDNTANDTGANSTRGRNKQIMYYLGSSDSTQDQGDIDISLWTGTTSASGKDLTDVNYLAVRFENVDITQSTTNKIQIKIQGVITT